MKKIAISYFIIFLVAIFISFMGLFSDLSDDFNDGQYNNIPSCEQYHSSTGRGDFSYYLGYYFIYWNDSAEEITFRGLILFVIVIFSFFSWAYLLDSNEYSFKRQEKDFFSIILFIFGIILFMPLREAILFLFF